jgi:hypothetical protein
MVILPRFAQSALVPTGQSDNQIGRLEAGGERMNPAQSIRQVTLKWGAPMLSGQNTVRDGYEEGTS